MKIIIPNVLSVTVSLFFVAVFPLILLGEKLYENPKKWVRTLGDVVIYIAEAFAAIGVLLGIVSVIGDFAIVR